MAAILKATATRLWHLDIHASESNVVLIQAITGLETFYLLAPSTRVAAHGGRFAGASTYADNTGLERTGVGKTMGVMLLPLLKDCPNLESFSALSAPITGELLRLPRPCHARVRLRGLWRVRHTVDVQAPQGPEAPVRQLCRHHSGPAEARWKGSPLPR